MALIFCHVELTLRRSIRLKMPIVVERNVLTGMFRAVWNEIETLEAFFRGRKVIDINDIDILWWETMKRAIP